MSIGALSAWMQFRFFDDAGNVLAGGKVYYAIAGGDRTQLGNVYSDASGTTPIANPVILDDAGTHAMYYGDLTMYHVWVDTADDLPIWNGEGYPFGGAGGGGSVTGSVVVVATYADLRALSTAPDVVLVKGRNIGADGGQGVFVLSPSALSDNDGTILTTVAAHSYVREYDGELDPAWFGVDHASTADQSVALTAALLVGPVASTGDIYLNSDYHVLSGYSIRFISGGFRTTGTPRLFFDTGSRFDSSVSNVFGTGITVQFGRGVCDAIRLSWFGSLDQSLCSSYAYKYLIDIDSDMSGTVHFPANYEVSNEGGSILTAVALTNVKVGNLAYQGIGQWLSFPQDAWVGTIDLGNVDAYLEWFGGVSGTSFTIQAQNQIPYHAAVMHGRIRLQDAYYVVGDRGTPIATGKALRLVGSLTQTLQSAQAVTVAEFDATQVSYTGAGAVTAIGNMNLDQAEILGIAQRATLAHAASAAVYVPHLFMAVGAGGSIRYATLINGTWTAAPGITDDISSIAKGPIWVATGTAGRVWTSSNNGATWASVLVDSAGNAMVRARYIKGTYIVCGAGGKIYTSTDAVSWNLLATTTTNTFRDVAYLPTTNRYIFVGDAATVWTSDDLSSAAHRPLDSSITGNLLAVAASATSTLVSGSLSGVYLRTVDGISYDSMILGRAVTIYGIIGHDATFAMIDGIGNVWQSSTDGLEFLAQSIGSSALLSIDYSGGTYLIGAAAGIVYTTVDLTHFDTGYIGVGYNVLGVSLSAPVYAVVGAANSIQTSSDNIAYGPVTVDSSAADWNNVKTINGVTYLLGASGRLFSTLDFLAFRLIPTGTTNDLWDIAYNSATNAWTVVGAAGYISTTANISAVSPSWVESTAPTSDTIIRIVWDGTRYTMATANNTYQTTAIVTTATTLAAIAGIVYDGTVWVQYGASGLILTSPDKITWTARVAPAASSIICGFADATAICLGTASGAIFRSTDHGATWASISTSLTGSVNSIAWNAGTSKLGVCGTASVSQSSDHGATWASITGTGLTGGAVLLSIWARGSEWDVCGAGGQWAYTTSTTWTRRTTGVSVQLNAGAGDNVIGDAGTTLNCTSGIVNTTATWAIAADLVDIASNVVLDSTGKAWITDAQFRYMSATDLLDPAVESLYFDGTTLWGAGNNAWTATAALGFEQWTKRLVHPAGVHDLAVISGTLYLVGDAGIYASSPNGVIWTWAGAKYDTAAHYSVALYRYGEASLGVTGARAFAQGGGGALIAGATIASGADAFQPVLSALAIDISDSTANVDLVSTDPGPVLRSVLRSVSSAGPISDSTLSNFHGVLNGNVVRTEINATQTIQVGTDSIIIGESRLSKLDAFDPSQSALFVFAGSKMRIADTDLNSNGPIHYGINPLTVIDIDNCTSPDNFAQAVSNGYAIVNLSSPVDISVPYFPIPARPDLIACYQSNSSLTSLNGSDLSQTIPLNHNIVPVSDGTLNNWRGVPAGTTTDGTTLTIGTDTALSADPMAANTLRYFGVPLNSGAYLEGIAGPVLNRIKLYGGIIKAEFTFPSVMPAGFAPVLNVIQPVMTPTSGPTGLLTVKANGVSSPYKFSPNSGSLRIQCNCWVGQRFLGQSGGDNHWTDPWGDSDLHYLGGGDEPANPIMIVITNAGKGFMPNGTKVKLTLDASLPYGISAYKAFFPNFTVIETQHNYIASIGGPYLSHNVVFRDCDPEGLRTVAAYSIDVNGDNLPVTSD